MNEHIILTSEQAQSIRGRYGSYSAIEPVLTPDNNYIILGDGAISWTFVKDWI